MKKLLAFTFVALGSSLAMLHAQSGIISTVAGRAAAGYNGDNIQATLADLDQNNSVAVDATGNIYIADSQNNRIRKVSTTGLITTIGGRGVGGYTGDGGLATAAEIDYPVCVRVDPTGNVYFSDNGNGVIRKITVGTGRISTIAGNGFGGYTGNGGQATAAEFADPTGICLDNAQNVYIADQTNHVIRKVTVGTGVITTVAGNGFGAGTNNGGFSGDGAQATLAELNQPAGVAIDPTGNMYIAEYNSNDVRKVTAAGVISTFAGNRTPGFNGFSGTPDTTEIWDPTNVTTDANGNVFISDPGNALVWEVVASNNTMYAIAGDNTAGFSGDGGAAYLAEINYAFDAIPDANGNLFISDLGNNRIRKITPGCVGDSATAVSYNYPECNGGTDGIIVAFPVSPFAPYTYSWSPTGSTNSEVDNVSAGTYTVTITDGIGCSGTGTVVITQPAAITITLTPPNPSICANTEVLLTAGASGGMGPLTYTWDYNGQTEDTLTVPADTGTIGYYVFVNDTNGCYDSAQAYVTTLPIPLVILNAGIYSACDSLLADTLFGIPAGGMYGGPNLTGNVFNPNAAGPGTYNFTYSYTDSAGCGSTAQQSIIVSSCTVGVPTITNNARIAVYPNPATDEFTVQLQGQKAAQSIEVYSITGQQVYAHQFNGSENSQLSVINTSQFPTGVYILKVILQNGSTLVQRVDVVK